MSQENPRPPQVAPRASKIDARPPQEAPRRSQDGPKSLQDRRKRPHDRPKKSQDRPKVAPRRSRRPKKHHPSLRTGSGGMRVAIDSAARPGGARARRARSLDAIADVAVVAKILAIDLCILLQIFFGGAFSPPFNPPRRPAHSTGRVQKCHPTHLWV